MTLRTVEVLTLQPPSLGENQREIKAQDDGKANKHKSLFEGQPDVMKPCHQTFSFLLTLSSRAHAFTFSRNSSALFLFEFSRPLTI